MPTIRDGKVRIYRDADIGQWRFGLPIEATQASAEDVMGGAMIQWPGVCALCWALEAIDMQPMGEWGGRLSGAGGPADALGGY